MASANPVSVAPFAAVPPTNFHPSQISSIKELAKAVGQTALPSNYNSLIDPRDKDPIDDSLAPLIPVIDFSLLTSGDPDIHAKTVRDLHKACVEWGFFMVINHGISIKLMEDVLGATGRFFELPDEEKTKYEDKDVLTPVRYGTSFFTKAESVHFWRDYLKVFTHPQCFLPSKPEGFREIASEYCQKARGVAREIYRGMSEGLGLEPNAILDAIGFGSDFQHYIANYYPPCPQPDVALGQPPHSDNCALTLLIENGISGLQVHHNGKWVNVNPLPNAIMVNIADQLEIVTGGKFRGNLHRVTLNNKVTRISLALAHAPSFDKYIRPIPELFGNDHAEFKGMTYKEYFQHQQSNQLFGKSCLDRARGLTG
jgi:isopenicillin N synthase-like dioxygenase